MSKKIIAILLALSFVFAFAACSGKGGDETTTAPVETTAPIAEGETEAPVADVTETATEAATEAADTTDVSADTTDVSSEETTEAANAMPEGKEAIVAYYNTAINNAKKNSKSIHSNYMKHAVAGEITGIPSALDSIGQSLIKDNMGEDDSKKDVTWTSAADKNAFFPVENETYASKLTAADVKDALTNVAMQIAAMNPQYISRDDIAQAEIDKMREIIVDSSLNDPASLPKPILNELIKKAGFQIVKDDHGDYEVIAGKYKIKLKFNAIKGHIKTISCLKKIVIAIDSIATKPILYFSNPKRVIPWLKSVDKKTMRLNKTKIYTQKTTLPGTGIIIDNEAAK